MKTRILTQLIVILLWGFSSLTQASPVIGTVLKKSQDSQKDTADIFNYTRKVFKADKKTDPAEMKANIDSAESICSRKNIEIPALLHLARAEYFLVTKDLNNASGEADIAFKLAKNKDDIPVMLRALNFLGYYNSYIGSATESIGYYQNAIDLAKKNKLKGYIPKNYISMGETYHRLLRDTVGYRKILNLAIDAAKKESDSLNISEGLYRLGSSLIIYKRDFKKGDSTLRASLKVARKIEDYRLITSALSNMGYNYYLEKMYKESIACYDSSLKYYVGANALGNLGTIYRDLGDTKKSLEYYNKSLDISKENNDVYNLWWVYLDMSNLYLKNRDTARAYTNYVLYNKYHNMYMEGITRQGMSEEKIRYEAESHKKELQLLSLKLKNQRLLIYGYTGLFILSLAIGILIISRAKINAKHRISDMNRRIAELTQANLRQQMNPHFIFNTLNSIQYYMYQHDKLATNNYMTKFSSLMRKVLENSQHTEIPLRDELDALKLYLELEMIRFKDKFDYEIKLDDEIDPLLYKVPTMLIQPYVENSISHGLMPGEHKGKITISMKLENEFISCSIEDNGIGREAAQENKKKNHVNHSSLGTRIVTSRLDLVNTLYGSNLKTIYTDLRNIKGESEGTRVEIQIPIIT